MQKNVVPYTRRVEFPNVSRSAPVTEKKQQKKIIAKFKLVMGSEQWAKVEAR